jgi:hypothetical protein
VKGSLACGSACVLCWWIVVPAPKLVQNMSYAFHALLLCAYGHRFKLKNSHALFVFQPRTLPSTLSVPTQDTIFASYLCAHIGGSDSAKRSGGQSVIGFACMKTEVHTACERVSRLCSLNKNGSCFQEQPNCDNVCHMHPVHVKVI